MSSRRFRTATLGLCLALLGGSLGLATSHARGAPEWMFSPYSPKPPVDVSAKAEGTLSLLTKILAIQTTFSCKSVAAEKALLEAEGKGTGKFVFSSCETLLNGTPNANCLPKDASGGAGTILTKALKSQLATHEGSSLVHVLPVEGETFTVVEMGASCPIGTKVPVIGAFYAKDSNGKLEVEEVSHVLETGPLTELWAISKTAEHKATSEGSVQLSLAGEGLVALWSGLGS